jgi:hypothetical protein
LLQEKVESKLSEMHNLANLYIDAAHLALPFTSSSSPTCAMVRNCAHIHHLASLMIFFCRGLYLLQLVPRYHRRGPPTRATGAILADGDGGKKSGYRQNFEKNYSKLFLPWHLSRLDF